MKVSKPLSINVLFLGDFQSATHFSRISEFYQGPVVFLSIHTSHGAGVYENIQYLFEYRRFCFPLEWVYPLIWGCLSLIIFLCSLHHMCDIFHRNMISL